MINFRSIHLASNSNISIILYGWMIFHSECVYVYTQLSIINNKDATTTPLIYYNVLLLKLKKKMLLATLYGMWNLVPWPGIKPAHTALGLWSYNYWTTKEVPIIFFFPSNLFNKISSYGSIIRVERERKVQRLLMLEYQLISIWRMME